MKKQIYPRISAFLFVCLLGAVVFVLLRHEGVKISLDDFTNSGKGVEKVYARTNLEQQARDLTEQGQFEEAIVLYRQAIQPEYINQPHEKSTAVGALINIYTIQSNYEEALKSLAWFLRHDPPAVAALEQKEELEALIELRDRGESSLTKKHIGLLRNRYAKWLPPVGHSIYSENVIAKIIRLYNTLGDHDAGIQFIDEILNWTFETDDDFKDLKGIIQTSDQAAKCSVFDAEPNSDWRECKWLREYLLVREAFEQDKLDGFKGCAHAPPGQVCIGKATKALIQSDYFPW